MERRTQKLFAFVLALSAGNLFAQGLFPPAEPLLGGREWARRLSPEFRVGAQDKKAAAGGTLRAFWGPWATAEFEFERKMQKLAQADDFYSFRLPVRVPLSAEDFVAPFLGYVSGRLRGAQVGDALFGILVHAQLLGLGFWFDAALSTKIKNEVAIFSFQLDRSFQISRNIFSFVGLKAGERSKGAGSESHVFLVTGSRF